MNGDTFFARLHDCLDARRDPLDDAELVAYLDEHPEHLAAFAALRADLRALAVPRATRRRWPWFVAAGSAAAAAFVAVAVAAWAREPEPACTPRILTASLEDLRPRAHIAVSWCVRQPLIRTPTTTFETWERRSEPR